MSNAMNGNRQTDMSGEMALRSGRLVGVRTVPATKPDRSKAPPGIKIYKAGSTYAGYYNWKFVDGDFKWTLEYLNRADAVASAWSHYDRKHPNNELSNSDPS